MDTPLSLLQTNYFQIAISVALIVFSFKMFVKQGIRLCDVTTEKTIIFAFTLIGSCCTLLYDMTNRYTTGFGVTTAFISGALLTSFLIDSLCGIR